MVQQIKVTTRPLSEFDIPTSEGYRLYSSLLSCMKEADDEASSLVHDSYRSSIHLSGLKGRFFRSDRPNFKRVAPGERYMFHIGVTDPAETKIFQAMVKPLIFDRRNLDLESGELMIEDFSSTTKTFEEILESASRCIRPKLIFDFLSPTCIQYRNSEVTEMFPHRLAVFRSLQSKWNSVCPEEMRLALSDDDIERYLVEKPDAKAYRTHSVMVNTVFDGNKGHPRPIFKQGFTGSCTYWFTKDAPVSVRNAALILAQFAEYSGLGSGVSRGCGWVEVRVEEAER
ncbi:CRISPR system precrRNA processing endoribonuclease RAMP protein Cas6 [Candidatus Methanoperedens nitratireducens]|uniref:CRISPR-associated protein, Cas6 family n=1 Tax=Candidatus Methanoperedens nitratireducens TaxID=1392998 RepID=A0A284VSV5_9EURY|nr:CRISPR system precrRNA processing endoribonuclease RAMP protein Cas6 [Candidatus Methanoperedens nitroreducens]SNQ62361.1 CRISPR-associated protein, Cas6 family [Candidatus Methanoperedens nitroreducens]